MVSVDEYVARRAIQHPAAIGDDVVQPMLLRRLHQAVAGRDFQFLASAVDKYKSGPWHCTPPQSAVIRKGSDASVRRVLTRR